METTKTLKIEVPEGYEIDKEKSTFENIVFKKVESKFSKNWKEFCGNNCINDTEAFISNKSEIETLTFTPTYRDNFEDKNIIPRKFGESILALMQLLTIREKEYTKGWEPDWTNKNIKHCILSFDNQVCLDIVRSSQHILSFPTEELRDEFYKNWKHLIEIAKPLL